MELAAWSTTPMPVCVDENIHYRLLKLCYGEHTHKFGVRSYLDRCPPLYGVWHAYKYVVTVVHRVYFSQFLYLLHGTVEAGRPFPSARRIRSVEMVLAVLLRLRTQVKDNIHAAIVGAALADRNESTPDTRSRLKNLMGLKCLLDVYVPACFLLGWQARNCVWVHGERGTGGRAKELIMGCLLVLLQLTEGGSHLVEYVRTMVCSLVCWTSWYDEVPGKCFTDEANEASLAQLGRWWAQHAEVTDQEALMNMYLLMPVMGRNAAESVVSHPSDQLVTTVERRLRSLLDSPRELVAYVPWSSGRVCRAVGPWPPDVRYPSDLSACPSQLYLSNLTKYALARLVQQAAVGRPVLDALRGVGLQERNDAQTLADDRIVQRIKSDCPPDMRVAQPIPAVAVRLRGRL